MLYTEEMARMNIRRVAWGTEETAEPRVDMDLVELLAQKILERLN